jgi:hypothetical protein
MNFDQRKEKKIEKKKKMKRQSWQGSNTYALLKTGN